MPLHQLPFPLQVKAHQEDHIQALQLAPQGLLVEDVIHLELLRLAAEQLALQPADVQKALALGKEGSEVQISTVEGGR